MKYQLQRYNRDGYWRSVGKPSPNKGKVEAAAHKLTHGKAEFRVMPVMAENVRCR